MNLNDLFPGKVEGLNVHNFFLKDFQERLRDKYKTETGKIPEGKEYSKYLEKLIYKVFILDGIRDRSEKTLHEYSDKIIESTSNIKKVRMTSYIIFSNKKN